MNFRIHIAVLLFLTAVLKNTCFSQSVGFYSYSIPNVNATCQYSDAWIYDSSEASLCSRIAAHYIDSYQCATQSSYPDTTVTTSLVNTRIVDNWQSGLTSNAAYPSGCFVNLHLTITYPNNGGAINQFPYIDGGGAGIAMYSKHFFVSDLFTRVPCDSCNGNYVGHPIDPSTGAMFDTITDEANTSSALPFKRFYNSKDAGNIDLSIGWRHGFSRSIKPRYADSTYQPYAISPDNSSLYNDENSACISGAGELKSRMSTWGNAVVSYANGACTLSIGTTTIATLRIFHDSPPTFPPLTTLIVGYDLARDDGQLISFTVNGGSITAPPGISLKLQQTASGFAVTDNNDNVEQYDTNGKLLTATSRSGVVQTMSYDAHGRLNGVSDAFGHQLSFSYDAQGRLTAVMRQ